MIEPNLLRHAPGTDIGVSAWRTVDQAAVDLFAEATGDRQFIHVDPTRAAIEGPFGGTVAHGFLTLALLATLGAEVIGLPDDWIAVNFAIDGVRFLRPVETGRRVRARFSLVGRTSVGPDRYAVKLGVTLEVEGESRPALTVASLMVIVEPMTVTARLEAASA